MRASCRCQSMRWRKRLATSCMASKARGAAAVAGPDSEREAESEGLRLHHEAYDNRVVQRGAATRIQRSQTIYSTEQTSPC